jgi:hypothetical protein
MVGRRCDGPLPRRQARRVLSCTALATCALGGAPALAADVVERGEGGTGGRSGMRLEPLRTIAGTGALLTYEARDGVHVALFTPGIGWSKPQRVAGGETANGYRLLTSRSSTTAAILDGGNPSQALRVRVRDGAGGPFVVSNPPVPLDTINSLDELGMGGDGTLYMQRIEKVEIETGVPLLPRLEVQHLRVLVRAPGAGWTRIDDVARLADRARAILPTDEQAALVMATSRLEPVAMVRADDTRVLVLWRRSGALEGALGTAAGFDAPFAIAGDSNFASTRPEDGTGVALIRDIAAAEGQLVVLGADGGGRGAQKRVWTGPITGPLTVEPVPVTTLLSDRAVLVSLALSGRQLTLRVRPPAGSWLERHGRLTSLGSRFGFDGDDTIDASTTRVAAMVSQDSGNLGSPQLVDVREACPATPPAGLVCPDPGAALGVLRGPLFVQPADYTDDYTDAPPLVRLLDGDAVLIAWAAERLVGRNRSQDAILAAYEPQAAPPIRVLSFTVQLGARRCERGARRCARVAFVRVRLSAPARVRIGGVPGGTFGYDDLVAGPARVATFKGVLEAGRRVLTLQVPTLANPPRRVVNVG